MNIFINNKSGQPIYEQIYSQIKSSIVNGELGDNELLPSIRNLAKDLHISVITTKRAYDELEREGFVYTVAGKGCFVAGRNTEMIREENLRRIEAHMQSILELSEICGLDKKDIIEMFEILTEEE